MNKRIDFLDLIKIGAIKDDKECKKFLNKLLHYYEQKDFENDGHHAEIFKTLYIEDPQTYDSIAKKFYINVYTLDRYRQKYNKLAKKIAAPELLAKFNPAKAVR